MIVLTGLKIRSGIDSRKIATKIYYFTTLINRRGKLAGRLPSCYRRAEYQEKGECLIQDITLRILPENITDMTHIRQQAAQALKTDAADLDAVQILRRSVDARGRLPVFQIRVRVYINEPLRDIYQPVSYQPVKTGKKVLIAGSGPAGLFAALRLIEKGIVPIVLERGKEVRQRRFDLKPLLAHGRLNPESNYCFGEGGAGTFSDGKLYTRSTKRGDIHNILSILVQHGADRDILVNAHPHLGSNRLPTIIRAVRDTILACNGQIHFNARVDGLMLKNGRIRGVRTMDREFEADAVILATGHSARDVFRLLDESRVRLEAKPFAMGVRVEHPQSLINAIQYGKQKNSPFLPVAEYSLACQVGRAGVYSFCMCPGGMLIPASTQPGELVLNGMSNSRRNMPRANAGIVVSVGPDRYGHLFESFGAFAGLEYQRQMEEKAFLAGGPAQTAPAQVLTDFMEDRISTRLPATSYIPGVISRPLNEVLPSDLIQALKEAFRIFDRKMKGFVTKEALVLAVESRTSSPVRIPRDPGSLMHPDVQGLFPAGEGAGYAGGIVSSAMDGQAAAEAAAHSFLS